MNDKIKQLLTGRTFEELKTIYEDFAEKTYNADIEMSIMKEMETVDVDKFLVWAAAY